MAFHAFLTKKTYTFNRIIILLKTDIINLFHMIAMLVSVAQSKQSKQTNTVR